MMEVEANCKSGRDFLFYATLRLIGILYGHYKLKRIHERLGSKYILGLTSIFVAICSCAFTLAVQILHQEINQVRGTILAFLILCDVQKAATLARFALQSPNANQIGQNIFHGIRILGPSLSTDTTLIILSSSFGFFTGTREVETLCSFAVLSSITNLLVFLTVYPAILLLISQFSKGAKLERSYFSQSQSEIFHCSTFNPKDPVDLLKKVQQQLILSDSSWQKGKILSIITLSLIHFFRWFSISLDQAIILILTITLAIRYLFFEDKLHFFESSSTSVTEVCNSKIATANPTTTNAAGITFQQLTDTTNLQLKTDELASVQRKVSLTESLGINNMPFPKFLLRKEDHDGPRCKDDHQDGKNLSIIADPGYSSTTPSDTNSGSVSPIGFCIGDADASDSESDQEELLKLKESNEIVINHIPTLERELKELEVTENNNTPRDIKECLSIYKSDDGAKRLTDEEVIALVDAKHIPAYQLEKAVENPERGVSIRRKLLARISENLSLKEDLPFKDYDYTKVMGACCENVVGYIPIPVGVAGPFTVDEVQYHIPMATTEGCLVASTNRGCRALVNGVKTRVVGDGMSRAPVVRFPSAITASDALVWLNDPDNFDVIKDSFDSSSRFARLQKIHCRIAGRYLFIRFVAKTGDAMGMNMISKGTEIALNTLQKHHPGMEIVALSGNVCTDKKPAAINWVEGRGKSVVAEAIVPAHVVENVLKTSVAALVELNMAKNLVGSAMAGSIGGFNAHAANIVTAIYIATGQDPAQNVGSSNCMTLMEPWGRNGRDLLITCSMPSIEVGTVGGGTFLSAQSACLEMLGVKGAHPENPGENARTLARLICATVLAGELSLMSALAAGHLVRSHLKHNRSTASFNGSAPVTPVNNTKNKINSNVLSPHSIVTSPQPPCSLSLRDQAEQKKVDSHNKHHSKKSSSVKRSSSNASRKGSYFLNSTDCKQT